MKNKKPVQHWTGPNTPKKGQPQKQEEGGQDPKERDKPHQAKRQKRGQTPKTGKLVPHKEERPLIDL